MFASSTRRLSTFFNVGSPLGNVSERSGFGSGPWARRISRARLDVPHGGPKWQATQLSCCKIRQTKSIPCDVVMSIRNTGLFVCFEICASTPTLLDSPNRRTSAHRPAVPQNNSTKIRSSNLLPEILSRTGPMNSESAKCETGLLGPSVLTNLLLSWTNITLVFQIPCEDRCLDPQTFPEKAFRSVQTPPDKVSGKVWKTRNRIN